MFVTLVTVISVNAFNIIPVLLFSLSEWTHCLQSAQPMLHLWETSFGLFHSIYEATWPARKCRPINVPIWGSDSISDCLNAPPLMSCGASQSKVFFTSNSKQTKSVFTSIENDNSSSMYLKNISSSLPFDNHSLKGKNVCSDPVETS